MRVSLGLAMTVLVMGFSIGSAESAPVYGPFSLFSGDHQNDWRSSDRYNGHRGTSYDDEDGYRDHDSDHKERSERYSTSRRSDEWDDDPDPGKHCQGSTVCRALTSHHHSDHKKKQDHHHDGHHDKDPDDCDDTSHDPEGVGEAPIPAAAMLFGSGLAFVVAASRRGWRMRNGIKLDTGR